MKVVASLGASDKGKHRFLIEAEADEITKIMGCRSVFEFQREVASKGIQIGMQIHVSNEWNRLEFLLRNRDRGLDMLVSKCKEIIKAVEDVQPLLQWEKDREGEG